MIRSVSAILLAAAIAVGVGCSSSSKSTPAGGAEQGTGENVKPSVKPGDSGIKTGGNSAPPPPPPAPPPP